MLTLRVPKATKMNKNFVEINSRKIKGAKSKNIERKNLFEN